MTFQVQQTQYAAGHGGFHVGRLRRGATKVMSWTYDCGTYVAGAKLDPEIAEAERRARPDVTLDVVFVSHFHEDHVKGIPKLAKSFGVKCVVAPLLDPWVRLAQLLSHPDPSGFAVRLAADPAEVLGGLADRVVLVRPGGDPIPEPTPITSEGESTGVTPDFSEKTTQASAAEATFTLTAEGDPVWLLAPFVPTPLRRGRAEFIAELETAWGMPNSKAVEEELSDPGAFLSRCGNQRLRSKLRRAYLAALDAAGLPEDHNWTSLLLYSGPTGDRQRWRSRWTDAAGATVRDREGAPWGPHAGWLHTGDACITNSAVRAEVQGHYGSWLRRLGTVQAPHHGSGPSWHQTLAASVSHGGTVIVPCVPGGPGRRTWALPATNVRNSAATEGCTLAEVTDKPGSRFSDTWTIDTV